MDEHHGNRRRGPSIMAKHSKPRMLNATPLRKSNRYRLEVEQLEDRALMSVAVFHHHIIHQVNANGGILPFGSPGPVGLTPSQIRHAYGFDQINFGGTAGDGTGETIAIVDAFDDPRFVSSSDPNFANSDLHRFDVAFGLA